jgi:hypothetical protein
MGLEQNQAIKPPIPQKDRMRSDYREIATKSGSFGFTD